MKITQSVMDLTKLGTDFWSEPGANIVPEDVVKGFVKDAADVTQLTSSVGDLLQLTRNRTNRKYVNSLPSSPLQSSNTLEKKSKKVMPSTIEGKMLRKHKVDPLPLVSPTEQPVTRAEVILLQQELQERVNTVMLFDEVQARAMASGNLFHPFKDRYIFLKAKLQNDLHSSDPSYAHEPWIDTLVKCESLGEVCDDISSKLSNILSVTSTEMGILLRNIRSTYRQSIIEMKNSWKLLHDRFRDVENESINRNHQVTELKLKLQSNEKAVRESIEKEIQDMKSHFQDQQAKDKETLRQTEFQMEQMSETLKNLNSIFKTMQTDIDSARHADSLSKAQRLEKENAELLEKVAAMGQLKRSLTEEQAKSSQQAKELEILNAQIESLKAQLQRRDESITELMEREALRNAEIEKLERMAALRNEADDALELTEPPTSVLCIKCKKSLDDLSNLRSAILGVGRGDEKVQCQNFRVLLPNLRGRRPHRTVDWIRHCMRRILSAKTREGLSLLPIHADISRFPEFVYAWFEPDVDRLKTTKDVHALLAHADEDRWGFYYGVKTLAQDDPEAKLFWALLDETHGEDGLTFVCHCLSVALSVSGLDLWVQLGDVFDNCASAPSKAFQVKSVNRVLWMDLQSAKEAVRHIMVRALQPQIDEIINSIDALKETPQMASTSSIDGTSDKGGRSNGDETGDKFAVDDSSLVSSIASVQDEGNDGNSSINNDEREVQEAPTHVNLFVWLRLLLSKFQEEQSNRAAAIRLMFDTASVGALTPQVHNPSQVSSGAHGDEGKADEGNHAEFPQFQAVMRTLYRGISTTEIASLYAQSYQEGHRRVTAAVFMRVAEKRGLFSRAMRLATLPILESQIRFNTMKPVTGTNLPEPTNSPSLLKEAQMLRVQLGAIIHRRVVQITPTIRSMVSTLPERWRALITEALQGVEDTLTDAFEYGKKQQRKNFASQQSAENADIEGVFPNYGIDGLQPYVNYRRLLSLALAAKAFGDNPLLPAELIPKHKGIASITTIQNMKILRVEGILDNIENALFTNRKASQSLFNIVRMCICARRIQAVYRTFITTDIPVPAPLRECMRPGYLRGRGDIKLRKVFYEPWLAQGFVAEAFRFKLVYDQKAAAVGLPPIPLNEATFASLFQFYGNVELAERSLHDLSVAVKTYQHALPRLRLFALFLGENSMELDPAIAPILTSELAVSRYLDLVVALHGAGTGEIEDEAEENEQSEEGILQGYITELFGSSQEDPTQRNDRKDAWFVTSARVSGAAARWGSTQGGVSTELVTEALKKLKENEEGKVEADDALWVLMLAWAKGMASLTKECRNNILSGKAVRVRKSTKSSTSSMLRSPQVSRDPYGAQSPSNSETKSQSDLSFRTVSRIRVHEPEEQPVDMKVLTKLLTTVTTVDTTKTQSAGVAAPSPPNLNEAGLMNIAASYAKVIRGRGESLTINIAMNNRQRQHSSSYVTPMEEFLRTTALWDSHMIEGSGAAMQDYNSEGYSLPRRLMMRVIGGMNAGIFLLVIKRTWVAQKELFERLVKDVEAQNETQPVDDLQGYTLQGKSLVSHGEKLLFDLDRIRRSSRTGAVGKYVSQYSNTSSSTDPITRDQLVEIWDILQQLISAIADLTYLANRYEYPRDAWKAGRKLHLEKNVIYR